MFKIAICDDEPVICNKLENIIDDLWKSTSIEYEVQCFTNGKSLCQALQSNSFTIVFQDIQLPDIDGIEVGRFIREELRDEILQIAYISSEERYAMELFQFRPINFLIKPLTHDKVRAILDKLLRIMQIDNPHFTYYNKNKGDCSVPYSDILYFESHLRQIRIVTTNHEELFYDTIKRIQSEISNSIFLHIHKSVLVNYHYIKEITSSKVTMTDGTVFNISQNKRQEVREQYQKIRKGEI